MNASYFRIDIRGTRDWEQMRDCTIRITSVHRRHEIQLTVFAINRSRSRLSHNCGIGDYDYYDICVLRNPDCKSIISNGGNFRNKNKVY